MREATFTLGIIGELCTTTTLSPLFFVFGKKRKFPLRVSSIPRKKVQGCRKDSAAALEGIKKEARQTVLHQEASSPPSIVPPHSRTLLSKIKRHKCFTHVLRNFDMKNCFHLKKENRKGFLIHRILFDLISNFQSLV